MSELVGSVALCAPEYGSRKVESDAGTLSGSQLHFTDDSGLGDLASATPADFNAAVVALIPQVSQAELSRQNELAKEAAVKEGIHSLQVGIQSYAVDHNDSYPAEVTQTSLVDDAGQSYIDNWPSNPYTGAPMAPGTDAGDYNYTADGTTFQLVGYGNGGEVLITVP